LASSITLEGIDKALENLGYYTKSSPKSKFLKIIRSFYEKSDNLNKIKQIPLESIISLIWDIPLENKSKINSRKKNALSLRNTINKDLQKLFDSELNPEGIVINDNNIFSMSDNAREKLLSSFTKPFGDENKVSLSHISQVLNSIKEFLEKQREKGLDEIGFDSINSLLSDIETSFENQTDSGSNDDNEEETPGKRTITIELDEGEEIEEVFEDDEEFEDSEIIELDEDQELIDSENEVLDEEIDRLSDEKDLEDSEIIELDEDEELIDSEIIELDEDEELIDSEAIELDEDEELIDSEVIELDEDEELIDSEVIELDEDEELIDSNDEVLDEDLEEIDRLSDDEIIDDELEDSEVIELDEDEELIEADEIELGEDEELVDADKEEHKLIELGLPSESLGEFETYLEKHNIETQNLLSEKFDSYLGAMDRYYNQFLLIEKNKYKTGSPYPSSNLKPESKISLNEFFIGAFPITNALFEVFIEKTGYKTTAEEKGFSTVFESRYKSEYDYKAGKQKSILSSTGKSSTIRGAAWYQPFGPGSGLHKKRSHPVVHISLKDALSFSAWIGKKLPTEDQWEAAARTKKGFPFPWGNQWKENSSNTENCGLGDTSPVDEYIEGINSNKISDTLGNVWEWTITSIEKTDKTFYIAKGGSFVSDQRVRLWSRYFVKSDFTSNILGFRCIAD